MGRRVKTVGTISGDGSVAEEGDAVGERMSVDGQSWGANSSTTPEDASDVSLEVCYFIVRAGGELYLTK